MIYLRSGKTYERTRPAGPHTGAASMTTITLMVAICHNMDLGDSWENADDPQYAPFSALGITNRRELCSVRHDALMWDRPPGLSETNRSSERLSLAHRHLPQHWRRPQHWQRPRPLQ